MSTEPGLTEAEEIIRLSSETPDFGALFSFIAEAVRLMLEGHRLATESEAEPDAAHTIAVFHDACAAAQRRKERT